MYQLLYLGILLPVIQVTFFMYFLYGIHKKYGEEIKLGKIAKPVLLLILGILAIQPFFENTLIVLAEIIFIAFYHFGLWFLMWIKKDLQLVKNKENGRFTLLLKALLLSLISVIAVQPITPSTYITIIIVDIIPILLVVVWRVKSGPLYTKKEAV